MAEERGKATMTIEDIRTLERFMFWFERAAIIIQVLVSLAPRSLLSLTALLLFVVTNTVFVSLFVERQLISRRLYFEPDAIFYIERPAILLVILHYFVPGGCARGAFLGFVVLGFTNCEMVLRYLELEQLPSKDSVSSETNTTQNAKETGMGNHDQEKKNEKAVIKERVEMNQDVVGLLEAFMEGNFAPAMNSITKNSMWESLTGEEKKALCISFWESLDGEEKTLLMNNSPRFESNSSTNGMETIKDGNLKKEEAVVEDEGLKETSEVKAETRNSVDDISECDSVRTKEDVGGHGEELKTEEDESPELQGNNRNTSTSEDAKTTEKDVQEQWSAVSLTDDFEENVADLKEEADETEGASDLEGDNQSWEKVQNDLSDSEAIESSFDQQKTDEVEEAKDEQAATGNYSSDDDCGCNCSWEVVQNMLSGKLGSEIAPSDQKKSDPLDEVEQKEVDTNNCNSDESSWEEVQNILGGSLGDEITPSDQKKAERLEEEEHKDEDTSNYSSDESSWEEGQNNLFRKSCELCQEEQIHEYEGNSLKKKDLIEPWKQIEDEPKNKLGMESWNQNVKPGDAMETSEFAEERLKWSKEKEYLQAKLDAERRKWEDEKKELYGMLGVAMQSCQTHVAKENGFAEERHKWNEEKNALNAIINDTNENFEHCRYTVNTLIADRHGLCSRLWAATSSSECYKAWYIQSEEHCQYYRTCLEEYQEKYSKLMEDHLNLLSKIYTESSFAEHYKKVAQELEDKCSRLEEAKTDLTAKLCAAKASSALYRSCLHDFVV